MLYCWLESCEVRRRPRHTLTAMGKALYPLRWLGLLVEQEFPELIQEFTLPVLFPLTDAEVRSPRSSPYF